VFRIGGRAWKRTPPPPIHPRTKEHSDGSPHARGCIAAVWRRRLLLLLAGAATKHASAARQQHEAWLVVSGVFVKAAACWQY
jgi:hypothetical protein